MQKPNKTIKGPVLTCNGHDIFYTFVTQMDVEEGNDYTLAMYILNNRYTKK